MATMQINYPDTTQSLYTGMRTGMMLGGAIRDRREGGQSGNIPIADPGAPPQVDLNQELQNETQGVALFKDLYKQASKLSESEINKAMQAAAQSTNDPFMKSVYSNWQNVKPNELESAIKAIKNNDPNAAGQISILKSKIGKEYVDRKLADIQTKQAALKDQWAVKAKSYLLQMRDIEDNINQYKGKNGQVHDSVAQAYLKYPEVAEQLSTIDPKWINDFLGAKTSKASRGGGSALKNFSGLDQNNQRVPLSGTDAEDVARRNPQIQPGSIHPMGPEPADVKTILSGIAGEDLQTNLPEGKGQTLTPKIKDMFMKAYNNDPREAREAAKRKGWKIP